jgi:UDP-N-acetylglucosamine 2-epimerase (non-hydrolysing)
MKKKILFVFGTRPEAIKLAPVIRCFKEDIIFRTGVCITAQHREMLDQVLEIFQIVPDWDLNIMKKDQDLFDISSSVLLKIKEVLSGFRPDLVLVQGDTTTSMISALASFYMQIPVGHIEAGLRTYDIYAPWPEEMNRQITGRISSLHFAPTEVSKTNLIQEGINENNIVVTGNTIIDALKHALEEIKENPPELPYLNGIGNTDRNNPRIVLITGHRRENFGDGFESVFHAINRLAEKYPEVHFVYPVHLNPNVQEAVNRFLDPDKQKNIHLIEPLGYLPFIALMNRSYLILTDSGGVQEEAPSLGIPVLVTRKITERPEGLATGVVKIVGTDENLIIDEISKLLSDDVYYESMARKANPYGDGKAGVRILQFVKEYFSRKTAQ